MAGGGIVTERVGRRGVRGEIVRGFFLVCFSSSVYHVFRAFAIGIEIFGRREEGAVVSSTTSIRLRWGFSAATGVGLTNLRFNSLRAALRKPRNPYWWMRFLQSGAGKRGLYLKRPRQAVR